MIGIGILANLAFKLINCDSTPSSLYSITSLLVFATLNELTITTYFSFPVDSPGLFAAELNACSRECKVPLID